MHFNTSHVTVYPVADDAPQSPVAEFQYISCYCLSPGSLQWTGRRYTFQYISCYCLSVIDSVPSLQPKEFQYISCYCLSPSISLGKQLYCLFQYISCYCLSGGNFGNWGGNGNFNTSHVTVYHAFPTSYPPSFSISIHLMLLFIVLTRELKEMESAFQYISCYCLS